MINYKLEVPVSYRMCIPKEFLELNLNTCKDSAIAITIIDEIRFSERIIFHQLGEITPHVLLPLLVRSYFVKNNVANFFRGSCHWREETSDGVKIVMTTANGLLNYIYEKKQFLKYKREACVTVESISDLNGSMFEFTLTERWERGKDGPSEDGRSVGLLDAKLNLLTIRRLVEEKEEVHPIYLFDKIPFYDYKSSIIFLKMLGKALLGEVETNKLLIEIERTKKFYKIQNSKMKYDGNQVMFNTKLGKTNTDFIPYDQTVMDLLAESLKINVICLRCELIYKAVLINIKHFVCKDRSGLSCKAFAETLYDDKKIVVWTSSGN